MVKLAQVEYPILADSEHKAASLFGVYDLFNDGLAAPAMFIIDDQGRITWSKISADPSDRVSVDEILAHLP